MKLEKIKEIVENNTKIKLRKKTRKREVVYSRAIYYKLATQHTRESLSSIGASVKKNHATVINGLKVFDNQISIYKDASYYLDTYNRIDSIIRRSTSNREKDRNPASYYKKRYASALIDLRKTLRLYKELEKKYIESLNS